MAPKAGMSDRSTTPLMASRRTFRPPPLAFAWYPHDRKPAPVFSLESVEVLVRCTKQDLSIFQPAARLATELNRACDKLLYNAAMEHAMSGAAEREGWARNLVENARALLSSFGLDPDSTTPGPSPHAIDVLLLADIDADDYPLTRNEMYWRRLKSETNNEAYRLRRAMSKPAEPFGGFANLGVPDWDFREALRSAIMGVAFIARYAAYAEEVYHDRKKHPKRWTHRNVFFFDLARIYSRSFDAKLTYTTPVDGEPPTGPLIAFCQAVSSRLLEYTSDINAGNTASGQLRYELTSWATSPAAIVTALRDLNAIDPDKNIWRRER
jgi:hypothetical protein